MRPEYATGIHVRYYPGKGGAVRRLAAIVLLCAARYDVIRGELAALNPTDLGPVTCLADDLKNNSIHAPTGDGLPAPGSGWFYLFAPHADNVVGTGSYGTSSAGIERIAAAGGC